MTKPNQKKLYDHFVKLSKDGKDEIQRAHAKEYAEEILKSFPDFEKKELTPQQKAVITKAANKKAAEEDLVAEATAEENSKEEK